MTVREISCDESSMWNSFVLEHAGATPFHLFGWKRVFENSYQLSARYLGGFKDGALVGLLPTAVIRHPFGEPFAVSLPICGFAGTLARPDVDREEMEREFLSYLTSKGVPSLELRTLDVTSTEKSDEQLLRLKINGPAEVIWKSLDTNERNKIRKVEKLGLTVDWARCGADEFFHIYARRMARLGTPTHSRQFFAEILSQFRESAAILGVRKDGKYIAAMFLSRFRNELYDVWAASLPEYDSLRPNMLLYWEAIKYACANGVETLDLGRSNINSGAHQFKLQWGATPYPLDYKVLSRDGSYSSSLVQTYRVSLGRYLSSTWKMLPLRTSMWLRPKLRKYIP